MQVQKKITTAESYNFNTPWHLWYHHELDNWKVSGYRKIFTINTINDFWDLHNNIEYIFLFLHGINKSSYTILFEKQL